ncbi:enoyl-CoA hydratase/isomerase family protein [Acuticoccus sp.]|uniref:enoyl-CoA hydratase/isomerase family protein n=1 Tax=Acuticoccus sp. TaxID=1904378 RepID=UPI003B51AB0D
MSDIRFETAGRAGIVTLNRPEALNALTEAMAEALGEALAEWARDDRVERVAVRAEGKAFCAGGDIRDIYERRAGAIDFFATEYRTNHAIATFPKPYVALIGGVCMGGGVGVSVHGDVRVASPGIVFAMPEVSIGLFPDVGASHLLSRMEGEAGMWLALTGTRLGRDEAAAVGFVTHPVDDGGLEEALDRIVEARDLDRVLADLVVRTEPLEPERAAMVADAFAADSVEEVQDRLAATETEAASKAASAIARVSPTSLAVTHRQVRQARTSSVAEVLRTDFRIVSRILDGHDFYEGIRASVIDKDRAPRWDPATLAAVDEADVAAHFAPGPHGDLPLTEARSDVA